MDNAIQPKRVLNKRPMLILAVCFAPGIVLGRYTHLTTYFIKAAVVFAAAAVCFAAYSSRRVFTARFSRAALCFLCASFALFGAFLSSASYDVDYVQPGKNIDVKGHVYTSPYTNDYGSLVCYLDEATVNGQVCGNIKLYVSTASAIPEIQCGDVLKMTAEVKIPSGVRNPGGFDERMYLLSEGIYYKAYADSIAVTGHEASVTVLLSNIREALGKMVDRIFEPDTAPIARGILLGDRQTLDEDTNEAFKDTGMSHILAVSGLNAVILIAVVFGFFRILRLGRTPTLVVTLLFIAVYACVTGLTPSIVRASIMAAVMLLGKHFGQQTDTLSGLSLAFVISLIINPLDLFSAGFQLSFGAVLGMLTLGAQIKRFLDKRLPAKASDAIAASVGASAGTFPVLAAFFNRLSLLSIVINIVILPLASAVTVLTFIASLWALIIGPGAEYVAYAASFVIRIMMTVIHAVAVLPFAAVNVASPPWFATLAAFAIMLIISKYVLIQTKLKAVLAAMLTAAVIVLVLLMKPAGMYTVFLDVGQGDAAFIRTARGGEYFVDGGRPQSVDEVVSFTVRNGITPDAAFVSHTDDDHFAGLVALYQQGLLKKVYCSYQEQVAVAAAMPKAQVVPLSAGDMVWLDDETNAMVLYPYKDSASDNKNDTSLVLLIAYKNHSILLTGDMAGETETRLLARLSCVDIYKAAHHGSQYSSYRLPLRVLSPKYSVISVGENSYGHPHDWAVKNLEDYSEQVYTTLNDGAVEFFIHDGITVNTFAE